MTFAQVAERLRKHGITCGVMAYEDGYQTEILGNNLELYPQPVCDTLEEATQYLDAAAKRLYPDTYGKDEA